MCFSRYICWGRGGYNCLFPEGKKFLSSKSVFSMIPCGSQPPKWSPVTHTATLQNSCPSVWMLWDQPTPTQSWSSCRTKYYGTTCDFQVSIKDIAASAFMSLDHWLWQKSCHVIKTPKQPVESALRPLAKSQHQLPAVGSESISFVLEGF